MTRNPFHDAYLTETTTPELFVELFSPVLVREATDVLPLFSSGNVVLEGTQGSGKSMLLALLKPEIRIAYAEKEIEFPIPPSCPDFVCGGINLNISGATDFGARDIGNDPGNPDEVATYFMDFVNYTVVKDILKSLVKLQRKPSLCKSMSISSSSSDLDSALKELAKHDCWLGYLTGCSSHKELESRIDDRLRKYSDYFRFNIDNLPTEVRTTKTASGAPISQTARHLRSFGIAQDHVQFFVQIDQFEYLYHLNRYYKDLNVFPKFSESIKQLLSNRDPAVSYRIATRPYGMQFIDEMAKSSATDPPEQLRSFRKIDLDNIFRAREHSNKRLFPSLSEDIFRRRLVFGGYKVVDSDKSPISTTFGRGLSPEEKAQFYSQPNSQKWMRFSKVLPESIKAFLDDLAQTKPLSAKLGNAWAIQRFSRQACSEEELFNELVNLPWESEERRWWKKERQHLALLQIAADRRARMIWSGRRDILGLSGNSVLVFISICQQIWDAWLRSLGPDASEMHEVSSPPRIESDYIQSEGIDRASEQWHSKIKEDLEGNSRQILANHVGETFRRELRRDIRMSYPGSNGFSVLERESVQLDELKILLRDAVQFGVLVERSHTSKNPLDGKRKKYYLQPILSPYYQVPFQHVKEPIYKDAGELLNWLKSAGRGRFNSPSSADDNLKDDRQMTLFDEEFKTEPNE